MGRRRFKMPASGLVTATVALLAAEAPVPLAAQLQQATNCMTSNVGSGWRLVRRVRGNEGRWHEADDELAGTAVYGSHDPNPLSDSSFSVPFSVSDIEFLIATGDCRFVSSGPRPFHTRRLDRR